MKIFRNWMPVLAVAVIGAGLVVFSVQTPGFFDRNTSAESVGDARREGGDHSRRVFTRFKSPWELPELKFMNRKNREITLEAFRDSYVLLNVWATWCAPCREEMPALDRLQQKLGGPEFHVLPLSIDEAHPSVIQRFYDDLDIKFLYVYQDPTGKVFWKLRFSGIPATILVDKNGSGMGYVVGPVEWDSEEVIDEIRDYMASGEKSGTAAN